jgi:pilus assembly protein FimV
MANNAVRLIAPALLGALILLFPADGLRALGLGEARVDSWLGQPLDVSIRLLEVESQAIESVSVGPASLEDFERLGVPSQSLGLGLEVTVDRSAQPPIVRVRSQRPVNDPVVQILIDARWSSGRVLREYTLFLDPPVTESAAPVREVSEPVSEAGRQPEPAASEPEPSQPAERPERPTSVPEQQATQQPEATQQPAPSPTQGADSITVSQGDTLWSIAQDWRPDRSLSMDQVMLAIFNRNRDAFLGENINRLRSDTRLDMPGVDDVRSVDRADAQRRVREHMRSWQPGVAEDVPVVSDAAMPESDPQTAQVDSSEPEATESEQQTADASQGDDDFRLDVVPPEEDQYSESSVVAEGEIEAVSDQLADVEREIAEEGLESEAFDDHVSEIRDALEQRDMAGLAVAEESLAELETRLREAREARAEQERLAQDADGDQATDSEEGDQIADYMSELEDEFGTQDGEEADSGDETMAMAEDGAAEGMDEGDGAASDESAAADEPAGETSEQTAAAEEQATEAATDAESGQPDDGDSGMTVTRTSSGGMPGWLWPAVGLLVVVAVVAVGLVWMRRRREAGAGDWSAGAGDAADSARASIARDPDDLAAHLALLKLLADQGREQEFTDAFDQMYQHVDDETVPEWQEALSLAAVHVPDHPLLTPRETPVDEEFDRREDEMLGMLDVEEPEDGEGDDRHVDEDDTFDLGLEDEPEPTAFAAEDRDKEDDKEDTFDEDTDLAVLSERLDDPSGRSSFEQPQEEDEDDADFREFKEIDEYSVGDATESEPDEHSEAPVELEDDKAPGPDLDFDASREQEADEVFGEAGARDEEDLDLELSSDVEGVDSGDADAGLDFDLGEAGPTESTPATGEDADVEPSEAPESLELEKDDESGEGGQDDESPAAAGGSLSDEDADVKLDLARAYISVDLADSARTVLEEVISDGSDDKRAEAQSLLDDIE